MIPNYLAKRVCGYGSMSDVAASGRASFLLPFPEFQEVSAIAFATENIQVNNVCQRGSNKCLSSICSLLEPFALADDFLRHIKAPYRITIGQFGNAYTSLNLAWITTQANLPFFFFINL